MPSDAVLSHDSRLGRVLLVWRVVHGRERSGRGATVELPNTVLVRRRRRSTRTAGKCFVASARISRDRRCCRYAHGLMVSCSDARSPPRPGARHAGSDCRSNCGIFASARHLSRRAHKVLKRPDRVVISAQQAVRSRGLGPRLFGLVPREAGAWMIAV